MIKKEEKAGALKLLICISYLANYKFKCDGQSKTEPKNCIT